MKKSKKFMLSIAVVGMVVTTSFPISQLMNLAGGEAVYAETVSTQGKCGDNASYKYDSTNNTLVISGTGDMWDDYGFTKNLSDIEKIVIEKGIQSIGSYSFENLTNVSQISIADSVKTIKEHAFPEIAGTVEIPKSVVKVESNAFAGGNKFIISGDVKGYETSALGWHINEVVLYGSAEDLGKALYSQGALTITIAQENSKCKVNNGCILSVDGKQLYYCISSRNEIKIPDSVENIATAAFCNKYMSEITLGKNITNIQDYAFEYVRIETININKQLSTIGTKAFYGAKIKNVNFAGKVKLGISSFNNKVKVKYLRKFKDSQTTVDTANVGKSKYNIKYAKVSGAKGYQIQVKKGKKTYKYFTVKNYYTKKAPKALTKDYRVTKSYDISNGNEVGNPSGAAYVTVRPYKLVKGKKVYGRWSTKIVLSYKK